MKIAFRPASTLAVLTVIWMPTGEAMAQVGVPDTLRDQQIEYSPHINVGFPQRVFWGDTHLHTTYSPDAGIVGNFNLGPA